MDCLPGFDGGLDQMFVLEVVDGLTMSHLANVSSTSPQFTVTGLNPGQEVNLVIKAVNSNGASEPVVMDVFTTKVAQLQVGELSLFRVVSCNNGCFLSRVPRPSTIYSIPGNSGRYRGHSHHPHPYRDHRDQDQVQVRQTVEHFHHQ